MVGGMRQTIFNIFNFALFLAPLWSDIRRWIRWVLDVIGFLKAPDDIKDIAGEGGMTTALLVAIACIGLVGLCPASAFMRRIEGFC